MASGSEGVMSGPCCLWDPFPKTPFVTLPAFTLCKCIFHFNSLCKQRVSDLATIKFESGSNQADLNVCSNT